MSRRTTTLSALLGAALGAAAGAAAFWAVTNPSSSEDMTFGPWTTSKSVGEAHQNAYTRAKIALYGIWGLPASEVVYFSAATDKTGAKLDRRCTYEVQGGPLPSRWWSMALYRDGFYIDNPANRYSWSASDIATDAAGRWTLTLAPTGEGRNRLTLGSRSGRLQLTLRLYQPAKGVADHRGRVSLPDIKMTGCGAAPR